MTTIASDEVMSKLFHQAEKILLDEKEHEKALDLLYYLEIQELSPKLRVLVNTTLTTADPAPSYWQKLEWLGEAKLILRDPLQALEDNQDGKLSLQTKLLSTQKTLRKQMGWPEEYWIEDVEYSGEYFDEDEMDDDLEGFEEDDEMDDVQDVMDEDDEDDAGAEGDNANDDEEVAGREG